MSSVIDTLFGLFSSNKTVIGSSEEQTALIKKRSGREEEKPDFWDPAYLVRSTLRNAGEDQALSRLNSRLRKQ